MQPHSLELRKPGKHGQLSFNAQSCCADCQIKSLQAAGQAQSFAAHYVTVARECQPLEDLEVAEPRQACECKLSEAACIARQPAQSVQRCIIKYIHQASKQ